MSYLKIVKVDGISLTLEIDTPYIPFVVGDQIRFSSRNGERSYAFNWHAIAFLELSNNPPEEGASDAVE